MQPPSPFYPRYSAAMLPHTSPLSSTASPSALAPTYTSPPPPPPPHPPHPPTPHYVYPSSYPPSYQPQLAYPSYVTPTAQVMQHAAPTHLPPQPLHIHSTPIMSPAQTAIYASPAMHPTAYATPHAQSPESSEREQFYRKLHAFRDSIGEPIQRLPTLGFKELDLWVLYKEVIKRRGIDAVIAKKQWKEVAEALQLPSSCTDSGFRLRLHYKKYLEAFERKYYEAPPVERKEQRERESVDKCRKSGKKSERAGSVTSSASAATVPGEMEVESGGTVSNESVRSSAGGVSRAEATSKESVKGDGIGKVRNTGIVKKKKRSGTIVMKKDEAEGKEEGMKVEREDGEGKGRDGGDVCMEECERQSEGKKEKEEKENEKQSEGEEHCEDMKENVERRTEQIEVHDTGRLSLLQAAALIGETREAGKAKRGGGRVDFSVLERSTLKRYARLHGVCEEDGKKSLAENVSRHFESMALHGGETATLLQFIHAVRKR